MLKLIIVAVATLTFATVTWAASPLASISSTEPFELNGAAVPIAGIPSWPVAAGDAIVTHSAPATIEFRDGSRVILAKDSQARIEAKAGKSVLRLRFEVA